MDPIFYYLAFASLVIEIAFGVFILVVSVFQLFRIGRASAERSHSILFIITQMLQAAVTLSAAIFLLRLLQTGTVPAWLILAAECVLSLVNMYLRRYHHSQAPIPDSSSIHISPDGRQFQNDGDQPSKLVERAADDISAQQSPTAAEEIHIPAHHPDSRRTRR